MDSPFEAILGTNTVLSDAECQGIRDFLEGPQKALADLTDKLTRLDALREELCGEQQRLKQFIDTHLALVSPARRLPEDIVRAVFMAALPSTRNSAMSSQEAPLLLCQICQSWRSIALTTPHLWAAIHIVVPDQSRIQLLTDRLIIWLERSGVVPLHISLVSSRTSEPNSDISSLLEALTAVSRRWKNIELSWPGNMCARSRLTAVTPADVPLLETIKINYLEDSTIDSQTFLATESLRSLTFPAIENCLDISVLWHHLRHLKVTPWHRSLTCPAALQILQQCTALQTCEFYVNDTEEEVDGFVPKTEFSFPELLHLLISRTHPTHRSHSFSTVSLPNLQSLSYYESWGGGQSTNLELTRLLPSTPALLCFTINIEHGLQSASLLKVLSHMPNLRKLAIWNEPCKDLDNSQLNPLHSLDEKFLENLTLSPGSNSVVCPLLESIRFQNFSATSDEMLLQFVQSRTGHQLPNVSHLSRVVASFKRLMDVNILLHLQDAISGGLEISLNYPISSPWKPPPYSPLEGTNDNWDWAADNWGHNW